MKDLHARLDRIERILAAYRRVYLAQTFTQIQAALQQLRKEVESKP